MAATLLAEALAELEVLAGALAIDAAPLAQAVAGLAAPCAWAARGADRPPLPSGISHRQPCAFSLALEPGGVELRALLEAQAVEPAAHAYFEVGRRMTRFIGEQPGTSLAELERVEALFRPRDDAPFRVWHGVGFAPGRVPSFKIYLSARARGRASARRRVAAALGRLGCGVPRVADPTILALDLGPGPRRLKVYFLQPDAGNAELRGLWSLAHDGGWELAEGFLRRVAGIERLWWLSCLAHCFPVPPRGASLPNDALRAPRWHRLAIGAPTPIASRPTSCAFHLGTARYVPDDAVARARIGGALAELGLDPAPYLAAQRALRPAPGRGHHHFVSFQLRAGRPRVTVYFTPRRGLPA